MIRAKSEYLFEASWEVCNKAGGINTVIKTKAPYIMKYYDNYVLIGPYFKEKAQIEMQKLQVPEFLKPVFVEMQSLGVKCYYGQWEISGEPKVILIDFSEMKSEKNNIKKELWEAYQVDSLNSPQDFDEPVIWAWTAGMLIEKISNALGKEKIVAHFHEWLSGAGLLYLKSNYRNVKTVFTTHATMLGRTLAGTGFDLYKNLGSFDPLQKAREYGLQAKHTMEVASAQNAHVFTTVSEVTSIEANHILGRKADVLVLNGIELEKYPTIEETSIKHVTCKGILREFLTYHFFPYYTFDLEHNLMFFFASRYEYHNKGMDILIKSLHLLNEKLKKQDTERTISVFFWVPMKTYGVKVELLENKNYYRHIRSRVDMKSNQILTQIVNDFISRKLTMEESFFERDFMKEVRSNVLSFQRTGNPSVLTHNIENENHDPLVQGLIAAGLDNKPDDKVKVIVYPVYLDGNDGLLNLPFYDAMAGCHLGIFPSYYEPWGYTPLEAAAMGIASITSDLAGFGRYIKNKLLKEHAGLRILRMMNKTKDEQAEELASIMHEYASLDHAERVQNKINAKYLSNLADWKHFVKFYIVAHNRALEKGEGDKRKIKPETPTE